MPTDEQTKIWDVMIGARDACKALLKPGLAVADLYRTYVKYLTDRDIEPTLKFLGHGIGQDQQQLVAAFADLGLLFARERRGKQAENGGERRYEHRSGPLGGHPQTGCPARHALL